MQSLSGMPGLQTDMGAEPFGSQRCPGLTTTLSHNDMPLNEVDQPLPRVARCLVCNGPSVLLGIGHRDQHDSGASACAVGGKGNDPARVAHQAQVD